MFWNLLNIGNTKLSKALKVGVIGANGMGNNILDYVTRISAGEQVWQNATSNVPADIFVIIELKSGGKQKGGNGNGTCLLVLPRVVAAMNALTQARNLQATYVYASVPTLIVGSHEVVGVVYNTKVFNNPQSDVLRTVQNTFLGPRAPFWVTFNVIANNTPLNIVGIHGPTSQPASENYKNAVSFTNGLATITNIRQENNPRQRTYIGGDFNVDPANSYVSGNGVKKKKIFAFADLTASYAYNITLPNGTLTSVRRTINNNVNPPGNYLSQPYDNIVFLMPGANPLPVVQRVNTIGNAPTYQAHQVATFNAAKTVSDHLPMTIEW